MHRHSIQACAAPRPAAAERHVFVYGTLRRGGANDITRLAPPARYVTQGSIAGAMFDLGRYPGVVLGGSGQVVGEVYAIRPELERLLDEIEEVYPQRTDEYTKREVDVRVADGGVLRCLVYEINPIYASGKPMLRSGDWLQASDGRM